ncbi:Lrp/AsnC family transcriptional regulator [Acerihabitans arboris]|uniref:AsnC family transcriptional regulator n=1 Tax=Acerihabitans arboris TaxID=2691583 RepID=A0A845SRR1_9GAMM|nr:Lrp/AsnC family transcriptional regulator [Acerihabitans arboris]NDL66032.1 AsnC family transcriptional regulator [Acerihabitans arboris]
MNDKNAAKPQQNHSITAIDEFDRRILARYQHDTRHIAQRIGEEVGLSAAAVQRRLKRMRESGIIERETATLDAHTLGYPVTCLVGIDLLEERNEQIKAFKQAMLKQAQVQQCYYVTGEYDFILTVVCRDLQDYERFTQEAIMTEPNVRSFTTWVVMDKVKVGTALPLAPDQTPPR